MEESDRFASVQDLEPDVLKAYQSDEIEAKIERGIAEIDAGKGIDGDEVFKRLREKSAHRRHGSA